MRANGNSGEVEGEQKRETKDRQIMGEGGKGKKREIELSDFSGGVGLGGASSAAEFINRAELPQRGDVQMTSALRGREGVSQILTKGRKVA